MVLIGSGDIILSQQNDVLTVLGILLVMALSVTFGDVSIRAIAKWAGKDVAYAVVMDSSEHNLPMLLAEYDALGVYDLADYLTDHVDECDECSYIQGSLSANLHNARWNSRLDQQEMLSQTHDDCERIHRAMVRNVRACLGTSQ